MVFGTINSTCMVYTKTIIIHLDVSEYWWIFTSPLRGSANIHHYSPSPVNSAKYITRCTKIIVFSSQKQSIACSNLFCDKENNLKVNNMYRRDLHDRKCKKLNMDMNQSSKKTNSLQLKFIPCFPNFHAFFSTYSEPGDPSPVFL